MGALIFDFDGVIADSEAIANTVLAEVVTDLGHSTTLDQALARYSGRRWDEVVAEIEAAIGKPLPADFSSELKHATLDRFRTDLKEVSGAANFIKRFAHIPRCIASSSSMDRLKLCLSVLALEAEFGINVFSADMVARGKPHPDIFLFAAGKLGVRPEQCLVIEDSAGGIKAAIAAGMTYVPPTIFATATILDCATQAPCIWRTHGQTSSASRISFSGARLVGRRRQGAEDQDHRRSRRPTRDDAWDRDLGHHRSAQVRQSGVLTRAGQTAYGSRVATH